MIMLAIFKISPSQFIFPNVLVNFVGTIQVIYKIPLNMEGGEIQIDQNIIHDRS